MREGTEGLDLRELRRRAAKLPSGDAMWRGLEELAGTEQFRESLAREFSASAMEPFEAGGFSRRNFIQLMAASMALAGVYGCSERPSGKILPYIQQPEQIVPGMPLMFATTMPLNGYGHGVLAWSHEGRPTKIEGNPDHPASLGGTNIFMQASILQLYDPERARNVTRLDDVSTWNEFLNQLKARFDAKRRAGGQGVRILTGTITSPTLAKQIQDFLKQYPQARWHHYDPLARVNTEAGAQQAFGRRVHTYHRFRDEEQGALAKTVVSLDHDFMWGDPGSLAYSRQFIKGRQVRYKATDTPQTEMNRLYVVESTLTLTGSMADHRIPARPSQVAAFARALAARLGVQGASGEAPAGWEKYLDAVVADLQKNKGESVVLVGESQPAEIHALGHAINAALGNVGKTVIYIEPVELWPVVDGKPQDPYSSLRELVGDMRGGQVDTLLILGENPAYTAPADIGFGDALFALSYPQGKNSPNFVNFTAHLGLYDDETSFRCQWALPEAHYLEAWGDARAFDGTASIIQPLISPLNHGRSAIELMDVLLAPESQYNFRTGYEILREHWQTQINGQNIDQWWEQTVRRGIVPGSAPRPVQVSLAGNAIQGEAATQGTGAPATQPATGSGIEIAFRPDPSVWDGLFSNSGWLQECPKFFTKLVWDNAAIIAPETVQMLNQQLGTTLSDGHYLRFTADVNGTRHWVNAPIMMLPGQPAGVITLTFGYGREHGGSSALEPDGATPRGFNAYALRTSAAPWYASGHEIKATGDFRHLVTTHGHHAMETLQGWGRKDMQGPLKPQAVEHPGMDEAEMELRNRKLIRTATLDQFKEEMQAGKDVIKELGDEAERSVIGNDHVFKRTPLTMYPGWDYSKGYQWGMSIDTQSCIGCNACLVACVAENNIAVVGRDEVARQREMHWIRIDQYFHSPLSEDEIKAGQDPLANPRIYNQPVACQHCENAPCELVCPVGATSHSSEGLNEMTYNRCVGTRYCSNNCPYKVRRFNFFNWMKGSDPSFDLQHNPEVTVRVRGVMEKCTYCVQRLSRTRIEIEKMIVRLEERSRQLDKERATAPADRQQEIDQQIQEIRRARHQEEFNSLENLQTACQQACPTRAIEFGNLLPVQLLDNKGNDYSTLTKVARLKLEPLDYPILFELSTNPRTTYMARLRNPNADLEPKALS